MKPVEICCFDSYEIDTLRNWHPAPTNSKLFDVRGNSKSSCPVEPLSLHQVLGRGIVCRFGLHPSLFISKF